VSILPWCVAVPFTCGALLLAGSRFVGRRLTTLFSVSAATATAVLCALVLDATSAQGTLVYWFGGWHPGTGIGLCIAFGVEPLGASVALGVAIVTIAMLFYAHRLFDDVGVIFDVLVLVHLGAAIAFVYTL
jgi:multicomponent Na+:H+ antiporter subunit D